jgi:hypothetical protein
LAFDDEGEDTEDKYVDADEDGDEENERPRNPSLFRVYTDTSVRLRRKVARNKYRSLPNPETLAPFLISAADACARMPRIKEFSMKLHEDDDYSRRRLHYDFIDRVFELWYLSAGRMLGEFGGYIRRPVIPLDAGISGRNRVYFCVGDHVPDANVMNSWREVVGRDGKVISLDEAHLRPFHRYIAHFLPEV